MAVNKIPESGLPIRNVSDTDYVRIVGADGKSYRVPKTDFNGGGGGGTVDPSLSPTSTNAVQNKAIYAAMQGKADSSSLAAVATSGDYNDLTGKPTIPSISGLQTQTITDAGGYFSTDTVEAALQQLGSELDGVATLLAAI